MKMALEAATKLAVFLLWSELSLFFNWFHHNTVNISIFYTKQIALFATAIYYFEKDSFNGLYHSERCR